MQQAEVSILAIWCFSHATVLRREEFYYGLENIYLSAFHFVFFLVIVFSLVIMLCVFRPLYSMYCLCINTYYCHRVSNQLQLNNNNNNNNKQCYEMRNYQEPGSWATKLSTIAPNTSVFSVWNPCNHALTWQRRVLGWKVKVIRGVFKKYLDWNWSGSVGGMCLQPDLTYSYMF
jgi:hypothetical protein